MRIGLVAAGVMLTVVCGVFAWSASGATKPTTVFFEVNHQRPVAGRVFTGLVMADVSPTPRSIRGALRQGTSGADADTGDAKPLQ